MPGGATTYLGERHTPPIATEDARFQPTRDIVTAFCIFIYFEWLFVAGGTFLRVFTRVYVFFFNSDRIF